MAKINEIIEKIEQFAPPELAESWDNSGWQINLHNENVEKVMLCTSCTKDVLSQAIEKGCGLIIAHHPLIFPSVSNISEDIIINAVKNNISIYSAHTNMDKAQLGMNYEFAKKIGLNIVDEQDFVRIGEFNEERTLDSVILDLKVRFNLEKIQVVNYQTMKPVKRVAVCTGAGAEFIDDLKNKNIDLYITSDLKYHNVVDVDNFSIIDMGHLESEKHFTNIVKNVIIDLEMGIETANEKPVWTFV